MTRQVFAWHDEVHETSEDAKLSFWRFSFVPDYDQERIFEALHRTFASCKISSYLIYEALGEFDIVARLWVPRNVDPEQLSLLFDSELDGLSLYQSQYMVVQSTRLHWLWRTGQVDAPMPRPKTERLLDIPRHQIVEIDKINRSVMATTEGQVVPEPPNWTADLEKANLLRALDLDRHGVRFYITFDRPRRPLRRPEKDSVAREIAAKCIEVERETLNDPAIDAQAMQISFYVGSGDLTEFLIIARAPDSHFYSFARRLVFGLHSLDLHKTYGMRTYTSVFAERHFSEFVEFPLERRVETSISELTEPESESLEFKATFSRDVRRWLLQGQWHNSEILSDAALKAICGLLNAPRGGKLVLGVLELARELERSKNRSQTYRTLLDNFPAIPTGLPHDLPDGVQVDGDLVGARVLIGIQDEFPDWDLFVRHFNDLLRSRIDPNPLAYVEIEKLEVESATLAVISCKPSPSWFYAQMRDREFEFFVRELAATRSYTGSAQDLYRRAHPRGDVI